MRVCRFFLSCALTLPLSSPSSLFSQTSPAGENADSLFFSAQRLQRAGDLTSAKQIIQRVLSRAPTYHDARILYGRLNAWEGNYQPALAQFDSVLAVAPEYEDARLAKAQVLSWMRRFRQAAEILQSLLQESPKSSVYLFELGNVYFWGGAPKRSLEFYERAYLQNPASGENMRALARVHRQLRSYGLSLYWYRKLLVIQPDDPEALSEVLRQTYRADHEIVLQGMAETFAKAGFAQHSLASFEYYLTLGEDWKPFVHLSRLSKFSKQDDRFGLGVYTSVSYFASAFAQVILSTKGNVTPRIDALAECTYGFRGGIEAVLGYRFLSFDSTWVHVLSPGITAYFNQDLWVTPRAYFGLAAGRPATTSWTLTVAYRPSVATLLRIGGFSGYETFRATVLNEISVLKSAGGFISFKSRLLPSVAVEPIYLYTTRNLSSNSHQFTLIVSFLI